MINAASMWYGQQLGDLERITINSYLKNGHTFTLYLYDKSIVVPEGVNVLDANKIINSSMVFGENKRWQVFSDIFRYKMLMETDYTWVDMDAVCLKSDWDFPEYLFGWEYPEGQYRYINNAVIRLPKNSEALKFMYDYAISYNKNNLDFFMDRGCPTDLSSKLLEITAKKFDLYKYVQDESVFYPVPEANWYISEDEYTIDKVHKLTENSHTAHISRSMLSSLTIPNISYLGYLADKYGK